MNASDPPTSLEPEPAAGRGRRSLGGRRAFVAFLLLASIALAWWHSYRRTDMIAVFGRAGCIGGVMSVQGQLLFVTTNIEVDEPWTARTQGIALGEGTRMRGFLLDTPLISQQWGFVLARHPKNAFRLAGTWCVIAGVPHWPFLPPLAWMTTAWVVRSARFHQRRRRGWCLECGYDLRAAGDRCPECGTDGGGDRRG